MKQKADLLHDKPGQLFWKYFINSVLSSVMLAVYVLFDTIFIGWNVGSAGLAALNITLPFYTTMVAFALMLGVGGATAMSICRGKAQQGGGEDTEADSFFTVSFTTALIASSVYAVIGGIFWRPMAYAFGADESIIELVGQYLFFLNVGAPAFVMNNFLGVFVRNDHNPRLAMIAGVVSCLTNVVLDYVAMVVLGQGMRGAVIATIIGTLVSVVILSTHFRSKHCTLRFVWKGISFRRSLPRILRNGVPSFIAECSSGLVILLFNIQLMKLGGVEAVTSYSIISNVAYVFLAVFNGTCNTMQPLISFNAGAGKMSRVRLFLRMGISTVLITSGFFIAIGMIFPQAIVNIFINPTPAVLAMAVPAIRIYFIAYLPMGANIVTATFMQAMENSKTATFISICRGLLFLVPSLFILSALFGTNGVWATVPTSEFITVCISLLFCKKVLGSLPTGDDD